MTTIWPPGKIARLSASAAKWINTSPQGSEKAITQEEIRHILEQNPSYVELCQILEARGIALDRGSFARYLLGAVPDIDSPTQAPRSASALTPQHGAAVPQTTVATSGMAPTVRQSNIPDTKSNTTLPPPPPLHAPQGLEAPAVQLSPPPPPSNAVTFRNTDLSHFAYQGPEHPQPALLAKPVSKAEAARKRNFNEIVDLTTGSDDDEPSQQNHSVGTQRTESSLVPPHFPKFQAPDSSFQRHLFNHSNHYELPTPNGRTAAERPPLTTNERIKGADVVGSIDKRRALRRSKYNVSTIARDVLLATGRHPDMRPLNAHLDPLRLNFHKVDYSSDLSTFRWELVDPGDPVPQYDSEDADISGDDLASSQHQATVIQQPVATADGPEASVYGASVAARGTKVPMPKKRGRPPLSNGSRITSRPYGFEDGAPHQPKQSATSNQGNSSERHRTHAAEQSNRTPRQASERNTADQQSSRGTGGSHTPISGYTAFRQTNLASDGTPLPRKRGRPVGWRKAIHGSAATKTASAGGSLSVTPYKPRTSQSSAGPSVQYSVFKCLWKGCEAELHNLETLRKHVQKLHGRPVSQGQWECRWDKCGGDEQRLHFSSQTLFAHHMEKQHLIPLAWKLGDGPAGGTSG